MLSKTTTMVMRPMKAIKVNQRNATKWLFPSGINYFAIARAERDEKVLEDSLKWMIPSGVNYKPRSNSSICELGLSGVSSYR